MFTLNRICKNYKETIVTDYVIFLSKWVCCLHNLISNTHKWIFSLWSLAVLTCVIQLLVSMRCHKQMASNKNINMFSVFDIAWKPVIFSYPSERFLHRLGVLLVTSVVLSIMDQFTESTAQVGGHYWPPGMLGRAGFSLVAAAILKTTSFLHEASSRLWIYICSKTHICAFCNRYFLL